MTVKIDGTNGIDTAQLRAPDGDPVAMTIDALGKLAFPAQGQALAENGYIKLPGGLIIQWGKSALNSFLFPIPFPTACFMVTASILSSGASDTTLKTAMPWGWDANGTQVTRRFVTEAGVYGFASESVMWIAIGY
jgi:hypothetical protein